LNCSNKNGLTTFLPLNKIQPQRFSPTIALRYADGFIDYAINLIESIAAIGCVRLRFRQHSHFETLSAARGFLGQYRIVTLSGELLEISGMTGGSSTQRSGLHFGTGEDNLTGS